MESLKVFLGERLMFDLGICNFRRTFECHKTRNWCWYRKPVLNAILMPRRRNGCTYLGFRMNETGQILFPAVLFVFTLKKTNHTRKVERMVQLYIPHVSYIIWQLIYPSPNSPFVNILPHTSLLPNHLKIRYECHISSINIKMCIFLEW